MLVQKKGKVLIPAGRRVWPHELSVAHILILAGHDVEFLPEDDLHSGDIVLDNKVIYEIKSPRTSSANSLEHVLKRGIKQSPNIIFDTSRIKNVPDVNIYRFLKRQAKIRKQIKRLIMIGKNKKIIVISGLIC